MLTMYRQVPRAFNALIAPTRFKYDSEGGSKYTRAVASPTGAVDFLTYRSPGECLFSYLGKA